VAWRVRPGESQFDYRRNSGAHWRNSQIYSKATSHFIHYVEAHRVDVLTNLYNYCSVILVHYYPTSLFSSVTIHRKT